MEFVLCSDHVQRIGDGRITWFNLITVKSWIVLIWSI